MSREAILKVKETEEQALQLVRDARARAAQMREETEREGVALCAAAETETLAKREEMAKLEKEIDVSRQFYNGVVKYYNNKLVAFPARIVGMRMGDGFEAQPYFKFH